MPFPDAPIGLLFPTPPVPGALLPLADGAIDEAEWARAEARRLLGPDAPYDDRAALAASLAAWLSYELANDAAAAYVCVDPEAAYVQAVVEFDLLEDRSPEDLDLAVLAADMAEPSPSMLAPPDVTPVISAGRPALRAHWFRAKPSADDQPVLVEEQVAVVLPFPQAGAVAVVTATTADPTAAADLSDLVEAVAAHVTVDTGAAVDPPPTPTEMTRRLSHDRR